MRANILAEMGRRELRQGDVAALIGLAQKNVSRRLHGDVDWKLGELLHLSEAWDLPLSTLIYGIDDDPFASNGDAKAVAAL